MPARTPWQNAILVKEEYYIKRKKKEEYYILNLKITSIHNVASILMKLATEKWIPTHIMMIG